MRVWLGGKLPVITWLPPISSCLLTRFPFLPPFLLSSTRRRRRKPCAGGGGQPTAIFQIFVCWRQNSGIDCNPMDPVPNTNLLQLRTSCNLFWTFFVIWTACGTACGMTYTPPPYVLLIVVLLNSLGVSWAWNITSLVHIMEPLITLNMIDAKFYLL